MAEETEVLSYRVPKAIKAELQKLADADRRKLGPYILLVLEQHIAEAKKAQGRKGK